MTVSENFTKKVYRGGNIMKGPLKTPLPPRPYNLLKPITSLSNINSKIKKMRCNVCQSQSSIDKVMGRNQKVCDMCDTIITNKSKNNGLGNNPLTMKNDLLEPRPGNVGSAFNTPGSLNLEAMANSRAKSKNNGLGNNPLTMKNDLLEPRPGNVGSAFNTPGSLNLEAMANARAKSKNNGLGNNPLSSISNNVLEQRPGNVGSAFNTPGSLNLEAMSNARAKRNTRKKNALKNNNTMKETKRSLLKGRKEFGPVFPRNNNIEQSKDNKKTKRSLLKGRKEFGPVFPRNNEQKKARLIEVQNEEGNTVWIDPKNNSVYLNSNATISTPDLLGGVENTNSNNPKNKGKLWYKKNGNTISKYLKMTRENYNAAKAKAKVTRKNRRNTRATRKTRAQRK